MQWYKDVYQVSEELGIDMIANWAYRDLEWGFYSWNSDDDNPSIGHQTNELNFVSPNTDFIDLFKSLWSE